MRVFNNENEIKQYFQQLKTEAKNYFGDDTMYAEKFLTNAKHIEFQVISDPQIPNSKDNWTKRLFNTKKKSKNY